MAEKTTMVQIDMEGIRLIDAYRTKLEAEQNHEFRLGRKQTIKIALYRLLNRKTDGDRDAEHLAHFIEAHSPENHPMCQEDFEQRLKG